MLSPSHIADTHQTYLQYDQVDIYSLLFDPVEKWIWNVGNTNTIACGHLKSCALVQFESSTTRYYLVRQPCKIVPVHIMLNMANRITTLFLQKSSIYLFICHKEWATIDNVLGLDWMITHQWVPTKDLLYILPYKPTPNVGGCVGRTVDV